MPMDETASIFYANKEQRDQLRKADLTLPVGFEYCELDEKAARAISKEIISLKSKNEEKIIALSINTLFSFLTLTFSSKIEHMPAIGIRHKVTGELASYATNDGVGFIANMYTRPQFRRLGLAKLVEQKLSIMNLEQ
jgi:hypothetical protein